MRVSVRMGVLGLAILVSFAMVAECGCFSTGGHIQSEAVAEEVQATMTVEKAVACKEVSDRQPVGEADEFPLSVGKVYIWTFVTGGKDRTVKHAYFLEGRYVQTIELEIRSERFRTWSYKTMWPDCVGNWKVNVTDEDGNVLDAVNFVVYKEEEPPQA